MPRQKPRGERFQAQGEFTRGQAARSRARRARRSEKTLQRESSPRFRAGGARSSSSSSSRRLTSFRGSSAFKKAQPISKKRR